MIHIRLGTAALNVTPLDWERNQKLIIEAIRCARKEKVTVLCLPELAVSGYGCEDMFLSDSVHRLAIESLFEIASETQDIITCLGLPLKFEHQVFNCVAVVSDGEIRGFVAKQFLPREGIHYEPRWFSAWPRGKSASVSLNNQRFALGDLLFSFGELNLGIEICEDAWVEQRTGFELAQRGANCLINPSGSHFGFGRTTIRERLVVEGSKQFNCAYAYANLLGNESGRVIYDGQCLIAEQGRILVQGKRFSFKDLSLVTSVVSLPKKEAPSNSNRICIKQPAFYETGNGSQNTSAEWEHSPKLKEEEFCRAVSLGLFDYLRKSRAQGFVVSLSGGVDSSSVAVLVRVMVELAVNELGLEGFCSRLSHIKGLKTAKSIDECARTLLCCVYQGTINSSQTTLSAAAELSAALGAEFVELRIDEIVRSYERLVSEALSVKLNWEDHDLALQNIQARARGPGVWMIANLKHALLLATSNRSEAAVGYTTMDGDTCGGLSPIAGVDKTFLRSWLKWMETDGYHTGSAIAALRLVNQQQPTAELRPVEASQTDEADLMPYPVLDFVESLAIKDRLGPQIVLERAKEIFPEYETDQIERWVQRFYQLWCNNQWKRERYAPCFHLDDENLDPRTWCRFPILSGGFKRELSRIK